MREQVAVLPAYEREQTESGRRPRGRHEVSICCATQLVQDSRLETFPNQCRKGIQIRKPTDSYSRIASMLEDVTVRLTDVHPASISFSVSAQQFISQPRLPQSRQDTERLI